MSKMIPDLEGYFRNLVPPRDALLMEMEAEAEREGIPIVGPVVGELLHLLAHVTQARRILELGTATGYSAVYLARGCEAAGGRVTTLEADEEMARRAAGTFEKAGLKNRVAVRIGDALKEMATMTGPFDLVFLDIDKEDYCPALSHAHRLLRTGGLLVADNVGFGASADFNEAISESPHWRSVHLLAFLPQHAPEKDGLCLALRV